MEFISVIFCELSLLLICVGSGLNFNYLNISFLLFVYIGNLKCVIFELFI